MVSEQIQSPVRYPSDLIDEEWEIIEAIIIELDPYTTGRPRTTDLREIMNAIFYINKTGCPWRYLPKDFPSYKLVNTTLLHLRKSFNIMDYLAMSDLPYS
jgi:putative transposase